MSERCLTLDQVATDLAVSTSTVRRLVASGQLRAARVGRQWRVTRAAVRAYLMRGHERAAEPRAKATSLVGDTGAVDLSVWQRRAR